MVDSWQIVTNMVLQTLSQSNEADFKSIQWRVFWEMSKIDRLIRCKEMAGMKQSAPSSSSLYLGIIITLVPT